MRFYRLVEKKCQRMKIINLTEDALHKTCIDYCKLIKVGFIHNFAEGKRTGRQQGRFKRMGGIRGIPDIIIPNPSLDGKYIGLAVELKVGRKKPTKDQKIWLSFLKLCGYKVTVCYTIDEFIAAMKEYRPNVKPSIKAKLSDTY